MMAPLSVDSELFASTQSIKKIWGENYVRICKTNLKLKCLLCWFSHGYELCKGTMLFSRMVNNTISHPAARLSFVLPPPSPQWASSASLCLQIRSRNPNEIIFGLNDGYYAADFDHKVQCLSISQCSAIHRPNLVSFVWMFFLLSCWNSDMWLSQDQSERKKNSLLQVDQSSVRNSYSVFSLLR